ncbi:PREDICTED: uncharacterized protein LOC108569817 [Nicrophorus vespilloides]|uniref:Uncharacterized protein LOC108557733 n=1 Tax=Nicrophorus vespilloides TaxID=110193 RepID=A0ABM1M5L7_NICVS|nr:PREDICTED: uncharacterized protein LOC108557733 [Nicrophorus vespilloides]XP_017786999.1 PREDICTED: uncharacterized protein LOC108569817 [Nicrophorus vespilloides]
MKPSQARMLALRLTVPQNASAAQQSSQFDKLVFPTAFLLAGIGVGVSSFSLKQLLEKPRHR